MEYEEYLEQGETLASEGLIEEALSRFEQALESAPGNPEVIEAVGRALLNLGRLEEAEASFLDALEIDPEWVAPRMGLALVALGRDEPFKIVHHLERAIEADPGYPESYVELGRYYGYMGEPALAKATFERWTVRHPEDADMLINAGLTLFAASDFAEASASSGRRAEVGRGGGRGGGAAPPPPEPLRARKRGANPLRRLRLRRGLRLLREGGRGCDGGGAAQRRANLQGQRPGHARPLRRGRRGLRGGHLRDA